LENARRYELLAVDLDGTLLDPQHQLPPQNRDALHRAHKAGMRIVLCTGRSYPETRPILNQIGLDLDAAVTVFGALVTDVRTGQTLERVEFPLNVAHELTDWFLARGFTVLWLTDGDKAGSDGYLIDGTRRHPAVDSWLQRTPCRVTPVQELTDDVYAPVRISVVDDLDLLKAASAELRPAFDGRITHNLLCVPVYRLNLIETFAPQVNKWYGIAWLCRRWNIDPQRTVAIGDDVNDLAMVASAGLGVAMGNAHPEVKRAAQRETGDNDSCGVAALIDTLLDA
jgi:Cof subfamily protein (haloacid dehalogenase superfamily)